METLVTIIHIMVCIFLVISVLLQAGKGGGMGAAFGGGGSGSVFGGRGPATFLQKMTTAVAFIFMLTSIVLAKFSTKKDSVAATGDDGPVVAGAATAGSDGGVDKKADAKDAVNKPDEKVTGDSKGPANITDGGAALVKPMGAGTAPLDSKKSDVKPGDTQGLDAKSAKPTNLPDKRPSNDPSGAAKPSDDAPAPEEGAAGGDDEE